MREAIPFAEDLQIPNCEDGGSREECCCGRGCCDLHRCLGIWFRSVSSTGDVSLALKTCAGCQRFVPPFLDSATGWKALRLERSDRRFWIPQRHLLRPKTPAASLPGASYLRRKGSLQEESLVLPILNYSKKLPKKEARHERSCPSIVHPPPPLHST